MPDENGSKAFGLAMFARRAGPYPFKFLLHNAREQKKVVQSSYILIFSISQLHVFLLTYTHTFVFSL